MARDSWRSEVEDAKRLQPWSRGGLHRLVKVVPLEDPLRGSVSRFVTQELSLTGKTPAQMEWALGLLPGQLKNGARIYRLARMPISTEIEYELTAKYPDGLAYGSFGADLRYKPGDPSLHQWRLMENVSIAVVSKQGISVLRGQPYRPKP